MGTSLKSADCSRLLGLAAVFAQAAKGGRGRPFGGARGKLRVRQSVMATGKTTVHEKYCAALSTDERTLVTLRDELYNGSWEQMKGDLKDRLQGKPYIFKLVNRIQEDLSRIEKLQEYERKHKVNLADFLKKKESK